jgi:hypothetical protein
MPKLRRLQRLQFASPKLCGEVHLAAVFSSSGALRRLFLPDISEQVCAGAKAHRIEPVV